MFHVQHWGKLSEGVVFMDEDKKYTIEEIKGAFWAIFHKSGETMN